jgi:competence protein ComEA
MNRLKALIRSFFAFSRKETNAFLILLPLMALLIFSEPVYRYFFVRQDQDFSQDKEKLDSLVSTLQDSSKVKSIQSAISVSPFNPNLASQEQLMANGFSAPLAKRVIAYRTKGGKFLVKSDLMKIYGLDNALYEKVYAYILLPEKLADKKPKQSITEGITKKLNREIVRMDLNQADTTQLKRVYGIGDKLSERIIKYREKLGGFVSINQLKEVYGLDSTVIDDVAKGFFIDTAFQPKQIKINTSKQEELASHPYINRALARTIEAYRFQHGNYTQLSDLAKVQMMKEATLQKLKPYLSFEP